MKFTISSILIVSFIVLSCKKSEKQTGSVSSGHGCSNPTTSYLTSDLLNSRYKTGTYWVYMDLVTNATDSVSVESYYQGMIKPYCTTFEAHHYNVRSYPSQKKDSFIVVSGGFFKSPSYYDVRVYADYNNSPVYDSTTNYVNSHYTSVFVYDRYYQNVEKTIVASDPTESNNKVIYYINSDFGFLQKEVYNTTGVLTSKKVLIRKLIVR